MQKGKEIAFLPYRIRTNIEITAAYRTETKKTSFSKIREQKNKQTSWRSNRNDFGQRPKKSQIRIYVDELYTREQNRKWWHEAVQ